ncbi:BglG family transcription antiterminator [Ornithinibacillus scapharcae]|uniref:BglG family transcription antiterminator n=1 Tax=Ornithinibacillus scapharcae TaxID=1147159 RepID=UPI000225B0B1|nr:BglG family transcription antiterminator [Ornithinibacillus scapharcae]
MYISARERKIIEILLTESKELAVRDLAEQIGVSERTIHRDLKNVEDVLIEKNLMLHKKSGVGIQIIGEPSKIEELKMFLYNLNQTEYTPEERQTIILCELLESNGPVKLLGLANDLNVTVATVSNDLTKMEERMESVGLTLIRRRGYGVELKGSESAKRRTMRTMISEHLDETELLSITRESIQRRTSRQIDTIAERLLGLVEKSKLLVIEKVVESNIDELPYTMTESAFIGLVVHIALAIERIQKGEGIKAETSLYENEIGTKEYVYAEKIVGQLEQLFEIQIPRAEVAYITMHLKGAKIRHDNSYLMEDTSLQIAIKARSLIQHVGNYLGVQLSTNQSLLEGIVVHLKPAMYRIKNNMGISNPLLDRIKKDYGDLFRVVKSGVQEVFREHHVPDEEIGYLVMHFGAALSNMKEKRSFKTVVICSTGIGTSKMLVTRLQKEFPGLTDIQNVSLQDFKNMQVTDDLFVISTIPIPDSNLDYIIVSPLLNQDEISKIRSILNSRLNNKKINLTVQNTISPRKTRKGLMEEMQKIQELAGTIQTIIEGFELGEITGQVTKEQLLLEACQSLAAKNKIGMVEVVVQELLNREEHGGLGIPGTEMALYHARTNEINHPIFSIYRLEHPVRLSGMDNSLMSVQHIMIMLSPVDASNMEMEVLSYISSLLIESEDAMRIFQSNDEDNILELLTIRFDNYFNEKIQKIRSV